MRLLIISIFSFVSCFSGCSEPSVVEIKKKFVVVTPVVLQSTKPMMKIFLSNYKMKVNPALIEVNVVVDDGIMSNVLEIKNKYDCIDQDSLSEDVPYGTLSVKSSVNDVEAVCYLPPSASCDYLARLSDGLDGNYRADASEFTRDSVNELRRRLECVGAPLEHDELSPVAK